MADKDKEDAAVKAEARAKAEAEKAQAALVATEAASKGTGYVVAPGKALTSPVRGKVVSEGQAIGPKDFLNESDFKVRVEDYHIVKA